MIIAYGINQFALSYIAHEEVVFVTTQPEILPGGNYSLSLLQLAKLNFKEIRELIIFSAFYEDIIDDLKCINFPLSVVKVFDQYSKKTVSIKPLIEGCVNDADILTCFYDLRFCLETFDFLYFLIACEIERVKQRKRHIVLSLIPSQKVGRNAQDLALRVNGIILPMAQICQHLVGINQFQSRRHAIEYHKTYLDGFFPCDYLTTQRMKQFSINDIETDMKNKIIDYASLLVPDDFSKKTVDQFLKIAGGKKVIVITLRDYEHEAHRKSNNQAWVQFIKYATKKNYFTVIVKDTYTVYAENTLLPPEFCLFTPASFDLKLRIALYARADLNLSVNCGPSALFFFIKNCKSIEFRCVNKLTLSTSEYHMARVSSMMYGEQPFYGNLGKNYVYWGKDTFKNIKSAFDQYIIREVNIEHIN